MKLGKIMSVPALLATFLLLAGPVRAQDEAKKKPADSSKTADAAASAEKQARDALAKFDKEWKVADRPGTWKVRMECLQALVKAGDGAVPVLVEALKTGSNHHHRAFAAQALGFIVDPSTRPALVDALKEKNEFVRIHALMALGRFGRQDATPEFRRMASEQEPHDTVRFLMSYALTRDDKPDPKPIRRALIDYDPSRMGSARKGKPAPDFALADTQGKTWRLSDLRGKNSVVLVFLMGYT
jgi:HEAT repeat protein